MFSIKGMEILTAGKGTQMFHRAAEMEYTMTIRISSDLSFYIKLSAISLSNNGQASLLKARTIICPNVYKRQKVFMIYGPAAVIKYWHQSESKICHLFPCVPLPRCVSCSVHRTLLHSRAFCLELMLRQRPLPQSPQSPQSRRFSALGFVPPCLLNLFYETKN